MPEMEKKPVTGADCICHEGPQGCAEDPELCKRCPYCTEQYAGSHPEEE
jgi:hypothetical protein